MTTILSSREIALHNCSTYKQMGKNVFVIHGDLCEVFEVVDYEGYEFKTLKTLGKHYLVTKNDTWDTLADRFFGSPVAPDFSKVIA